MGQPSIKRLVGGSDSNDNQQALKLGFAINDTARLRRHAFDTKLNPAGFTTAQVESGGQSHRKRTADPNAL